MKLNDGAAEQQEVTSLRDTRSEKSPKTPKKNTSTDNVMFLTPLTRSVGISRGMKKTLSTPHQRVELLGSLKRNKTQKGS